LVKTELAGGLPVVSADRVQIQQVVLNLIVNAVEAMTMDSEQPGNLGVATGTDTSGHVVVTISDSGPGLTAEYSDRVFEACHTTKPGGLGMGLAICRSIVESHGGTIWVTRNEPRGAVFQFALPVGAAEQPALSCCSEAGRGMDFHSMPAPREGATLRNDLMNPRREAAQGGGSRDREPLMASRRPRHSGPIGAAMTWLWRRDANLPAEAPDIS